MIGIGLRPVATLLSGPLGSGRFQARCHMERLQRDFRKRDAAHPSLRAFGLSGEAAAGHEKRGPLADPAA